MSDILHEAQQRIKQIRQKDVELLVLKNGEPVEDAGVIFRNTLYDLIHREWHSDADLSTGSAGLCKTRLFCGNYDITVDIQGEKTTVNRDVVRESFYAGGGEPRRLVVKL